MSFAKLSGYLSVGTPTKVYDFATMGNNVIQKIIVTNQNDFDVITRFAVVPAGIALTDQYWRVWKKVLVGGQNRNYLGKGESLAGGYDVYLYSDTSLVNYNLVPFDGLTPP